MDTRDALERMPDADLMLRVQLDSETAFAELYRRYYRKLLDFFYAMGVSASRGVRRDAQLAEDLCHETFLRLWQLRARYKPSGSFSAYLFSVARHIWQERRRQARKDWQLGMVQPPDGLDNLPAAGSGAAPDELAHRSEVNDRVYEALEQLPEEQRMAFVLRTIEGLPLEDIAQVMNCPVNTVRSRRLLAIKRLREMLRGLFVL